MQNISDRLIEGYSGVVQPWECDNLGHLNVSHHFGRSSDQAFFLRQALGLNPHEMREQNHGTVALEEHARFHREIRSGELLYGNIAPVEFNERTLVSYSELRNAKNELVTTFKTLVGNFDTKIRRLIPWNEAIQAAIMRHQISLPAHAAPRHISTQLDSIRKSSQAETKNEGFIRSGGTGVNQWECDQFGHMNTMFYVRRQTEAVPNFWHKIGLERAKLTELDLSFVVGEMRLNYYAELVAGDVITTWSNLRELTNKTMLIEHRIFNAATDTLSAVSLVRGVCFNLTKRRAQEIPDSIRNTLTHK